jgi:RNA polymerase sigma-70 factor (ECF subfamily)
MDSTPTPLDPELLLAHAGFVRSVARSLLRDGSAVDDVVQQTWLTALERPPRDAGALRRWLARVVHSVARESRRADERRARREIASAPSEVDPDDPARLVERLARMRALTDAVLALPPPYRDAIVRRHLEELTPAEIARRDGVPVATIETRLKRARKQLRERLETSFGIGRDALALLVTGVKAGATWKAATLAAAATVLLAGAATWRVVAAMRAPGTAEAAAIDGAGMLEHATSNGAAPTHAVGGDPLAATVSEVDPRTEWPDAESLRRMERRGRALVFGVVTSPDGSPCADASIGFRGQPIATSDARGAWRSEVPTIDWLHAVIGSPVANADQFVAHKAGVGVAVVRWSGPSRRIDFALERGHAFTGTVVDFDDGKRIGGVALDLCSEVNGGRGDVPVLRLHAIADESGKFAFENLPSGGAGIRGRAAGYDSNGFVGFDFRKERDVDVTFRLRRTASLRGRFVPWPAPGVEAHASSVRVAAHSPHDMLDEGSEASGPIDADGRFEVELPCCPFCVLELVVDGAPFDSWRVETNEQREPFDLGKVEVPAAGSLSGRLALPDRSLRDAVTAEVSLNSGSGGVSRTVRLGADGAFRIAPLKPGYLDLRLRIDRQEIANLNDADPELLRQREERGTGSELDPGEARDVGVVVPHVALAHGVVCDAQGDPVAGAFVETVITEGALGGRFFVGSLLASDVADADGRYVLVHELDRWSTEVPEPAEAPAEFALEVEVYGYALQHFAAPELGDIRHATWTRHDLVLADGIVLRGTVVDAAGRPVSGARVWAQSCAALAARSIDLPLSGGSDFVHGDGSFEFRGAAAGEYRLRVTPTESSPEFEEQTFTGVHPEEGPCTLRLADPSQK